MTAGNQPSVKPSTYAEDKVRALAGHARMFGYSREQAIENYMTGDWLPPGLSWTVDGITIINEVYHHG